MKPLRSAFEQQTRLRAPAGQTGQRLEIKRRGGQADCQFESDIQSTWQSGRAGLHLTTDNNIVFASDQQENEKQRASSPTSVGSALKVTGAHNRMNSCIDDGGWVSDSRDAWLGQNHLRRS